MNLQEWISIGILLLVSFVLLKILFRLLLSLLLLIVISTGVYYDYTLYKEAPEKSYFFKYILTKEDSKKIDKKIEEVKEKSIKAVKEVVANTITKENN